MEIMKILLFILELQLYATSQQNRVHGVVTEYGIFSMGEIVEIAPAPESNTGVLTTHDDYTIKEITENIPAILGVSFGYCYDIFVPNRDSVTLTRSIRHPAMQKPDQSISTGYSYNKEFEVIDGFVSACTAYTYEEEWEVVTGDWLFEISINGKKIVDQRFTLFEP